MKLKMKLEIKRNRNKFYFVFKSHTWLTLSSSIFVSQTQSEETKVGSPLFDYIKRLKVVHKNIYKNQKIRKNKIKVQKLEFGGWEAYKAYPILNSVNNSVSNTVKHVNMLHWKDIQRKK